MTQIPGVHIETLHNPVRYTYAQIEEACAIAELLNRDAAQPTETNTADGYVVTLDTATGDVSTRQATTVDIAQSCPGCGGLMAPVMKCMGCHTTRRHECPVVPVTTARDTHNEAAEVPDEPGMTWDGSYQQAYLRGRADAAQGVPVGSDPADPMPYVSLAPAWAMLAGYVDQAREDGEQIDPAELLTVMREFKADAYKPVHEWWHRSFREHPSPWEVSS